MKALMPFLLFITLFLSCKNDKTTSKRTFEPLLNEAETVVTVGMQEEFDSVPKLTVEQITEKEFNAIDEIVQFENYTAEETANDFFIPTKQKKHQFKKYSDDGENKGWNGFELLGYHDGIDAFAIIELTTSDDLGFGQLFLLDSITNYRYNIESIGDGSVELPTVSPNNNYLAYCYNQMYESNKSDIRVLKINDKSSPAEYLNVYRNSDTQNFKINKLVWDTDEHLYIEASKENYENDSLVSVPEYYRAKF